jgi:hypothetical protein
VWVCGLSLAGIAGSNSAGDMDVGLLGVLCCCQVEVSAMGPSLVQRGPTECGVSVYDREASTIRRTWPPGGGGGFCAMRRKKSRSVDSQRISQALCGTVS